MRVPPMSLKAFGLFTKLLKGGHSLADLGLDGTPGDVKRLSARLRLVKSFRGLDLDGISPRTAKGYSGLMLAFLTHSVLEQYVQLTRQRIGDLESAQAARQSARVVEEVFNEDKDGKLFDF